MPSFPREQIDYGWVIDYKTKKLKLAFENFKTVDDKSDFDAFCEAEKRWLDDFAEFMAIKIHHGGGPWVDWAQELVQRDAKALAQAPSRFG